MAVHLNATTRATAKAQNYPPPPEVTIEMLQPSIRAFWQAYAKSRGLNGYEEQMTLLRAARFTAGRMIVAILEYLGTSQELGSLGNTMLTISAGLLESPHLGLMQLMGAPLT